VGGEGGQELVEETTTQPAVEITMGGGVLGIVGGQILSGGVCGEFPQDSFKDLVQAPFTGIKAPRNDLGGWAVF